MGVVRATRVAALALAVLGALHGGARLEAQASSPRPAGRAPSVDGAIKDLNLIRPARRTLAEDFTLPLHGGGTFKLSAQRGKVVFINFWATWCPPCREEMPSMERLHARHREGRFTMVAVSVDASPDAVGPFVKQGRYTFPVALDPRMSVASAYGVRGLPATFIVDAEGVLVAMALGQRGWDGPAAHALVSALLPTVGR